MQHCTNSVVNTSIGAVPYANIAVTNLDGTPAQLYSDNGITAITGNVAIADKYGNFSFYAANGRYVLTISGGGIDTIVVADLLLYDPVDEQANINAALQARSDAQGYANQSASSAVQANNARDAAIAAWQAGTAPNEQLSAISKQFHVGSIVDVFLYDTRRDSDGGVWRKRCRHTSWENEVLPSGRWMGYQANLAGAIAAGSTTGDYYQSAVDGKFYLFTAPGTITETWRGNTREFPALALIVAESSRVIVYDATHPELPMWMVFAVGVTSYSTGNAIAIGTLSSVTAVNGTILIGSNNATDGSLMTASMLADTFRLSQFDAAIGGLYRGRIADRNSGKGYPQSNAGYTIISKFVNDVAATVLPDAPIDPSTGLAAPTVAVATSAGMSVLKHDGTVVNASETSSTKAVWFAGKTLVREYVNGVCPIQYPAYLSATFVQSAQYDLTHIPYVLATALACGTSTKDSYAAGGSTALTLLKENPASPQKGMSAFITNAYNSGWQVGDIRGAWLADTVAETVTASGELVTNGTFNTDASGWSVTNFATIAAVGGKLQITSDNTGSHAGGAYQAVTVVPGRTYKIVFDYTPGTSPVALLNVGSSIGTSAFAQMVLGGVAGTYSVDITPNVSTVYLSFYNNVVTASVTSLFDNISVKLASTDRSIKNHGLTISGSLTKAAIATGAQLVAFSGFSASSYLEQPYNSDLDFGTGDFCAIGWFKAAVPSSIIPFMMSRGPSTGGATTFDVYQDPSGFIKTRAAGVTLTGATNLADGNWHMVVSQRISGVLYLYVDNVLVTSAACAGTVSNASAVLRLGTSYDGTNPYNGSLSLWRVGATPASSDQLAQIYRDELAMFQPGAQCTIDGTSTNVTALAYDDTADLLHVGTSWGRSAFKGLQRVESSATSVGTVTALSAALGAHITGGQSAARYVQPAMQLRDELRRRDELRWARTKEIITVDLDFTPGQTSYTLPYGFTAMNLWAVGAPKREGSTKDYTRSFDGYRETITFAAAPLASGGSGTAWVRLDMSRSTA